MAPRRRDRISKLPVEILDHILGFLPIKDAAKTAVLSSIWRDVWFNLTQLNFDHHFFSYMVKKHRGASNYVKKSAASLYVINKVLLQHNGPIQKFVLNFVGAGILTIKSRSYDFDQWLLLVTRKGVEEMNIHLRPHNIYKLPNYIFSCSTLKRLHLSNVVVQPMKSPCILPNVSLLSFKYVNFDPIKPPHCAIDVPVLESLLFDFCENMFNFNMTAPKLCDLTIANCYSHVDKFLPVNLDLRSVSTLDLQYSYIKKFVEEISRMGFQLNVESLKLSFHYQSDVTTPALVHLLQSCPKLCRLDINVFALEVWATRYNGAFLELLSKLHGVAQTNKMLRDLKLISFRGLQSEILFVKELLVCFSTLEKVFINFNEYYLNKELEFEIMRELLHFPRASTEAKIIVI